VAKAVFRIRIRIGSGSRRAKITHKNRKKLRNSCFEKLDVLFFDSLKGLSHEIDFKNVDNNLQYLA
jgi:hypothetical protein